MSSPSPPEHIRKRRQRNGNHDKNNYNDDYSSFSDDPSTSYQSATSSSSRSHGNRKHRHHHRHDPPPAAPSNPDSSTNTLVNSARSSSPANSDSTIDLPQRFDEKGRKIPEEGEDPLVDMAQNLLGEGGGFSKFLKGFLGGEDDPLGDGDKKGRRRRRD